jgi:SAM-dependent methyltransferase
VTRTVVHPSIAALDLALAQLATAVTALERTLAEAQAAPDPGPLPQEPAPASPLALLPAPAQPSALPDAPAYPPLSGDVAPTAPLAPALPPPRSRLERLAGMPGLGALFAALGRILTAPSRVEALSARLEALDAARVEEGATLRRHLASALGELEARRAQDAAYAGQALAGLTGSLHALVEYAGAVAERLGARDGTMGEHAQRLTQVAGRVAAVEDMLKRQETLRQAVGGLKPLSEALSVLRGAIAALESALRAPPAEPADSISAVPARVPDPALDAYYLAFENRFRGSREDIMGRVRAFLGDVQAATTAAPGLPVVDLGPGRGEWLDVLRDAGIPAMGVDTNTAMLSDLRARGLVAHEGDALAYVRALPAASVAAVTGFHIAEHLEFSGLAALFREAFRALHPGGVLVFETPNPENLIVGACTFWYDPTHVRPLPPPVLLFMAEQAGFERAEVRRLHPPPEGEIPPLPENATPLEARVHALLHGPRDYAVVGWRP